MMAFLLRRDALPIAGGLFVLEIFTSLVQEKIGTRLGRRLVLRAPFHHALTFRGIAEPKASCGLDRLPPARRDRAPLLKVR